MWFGPAEGVVIWSWGFETLKDALGHAAARLRGSAEALIGRPARRGRAPDHPLSLSVRPRHLRRLLPPQRDLRGHHPLPLHHQQAAGAAAVPPAAEALVSLQARHDPVVPTASALGASGHCARLVRQMLRTRGLAVLRFNLWSGSSAAPYVTARQVEDFLRFEAVMCCGYSQLQGSFRMRRHLCRKVYFGFFYAQSQTCIFTHGFNWSLERTAEGQVLRKLFS